MHPTLGHSSVCRERIIREVRERGDEAQRRRVQLAEDRDDASREVAPPEPHTQPSGELDEPPTKRARAIHSKNSSSASSSSSSASSSSSSTNPITPQAATTPDRGGDRTESVETRGRDAENENENDRPSKKPRTKPLQEVHALQVREVEECAARACQEGNYTTDSLLEVLRLMCLGTGAVVM